MRECPYKIVECFACQDLPNEGGPVESADGLLEALVMGGDRKGRYFAAPKLLRCLFWWQETDAELVRSWRDDLVARGEVEIKPIGRCCYTDSLVEVVAVTNPHRFKRLSPRKPIPHSLRNQIYERDSFKCVWCEATRELSIDHIKPLSKGGSDEPENLQTLCRSCNSRKHNTDDEIAKRRVIGEAA